MSTNDLDFLRPQEDRALADALSPGEVLTISVRKGSPTHLWFEGLVAEAQQRASEQSA